MACFIISGRKKMSELKEKIVSEIKKIYDPEIPVNIYELGLIYKMKHITSNLIYLINHESSLHTYMNIVSPITLYYH